VLGEEASSADGETKRFETALARARCEMVNGRHDVADRIRDRSERQPEAVKARQLEGRAGLTPTTARYRSGCASHHELRAATQTP